MEVPLGVMTNRRAAYLVLALAAAGCSSIETTDPGPTTIELTADRTSAATGEEIEFTFSGTGSSIIAVMLDYGDGAQERVDASGATSAAGRRTHAFSEAGAFVVTATIEDAITGSVSDEVTVQITSP
jgi:hypothetical protein